MNTKLTDIKAENPLVLIGGGRMGSAMLSGWLAGGLSVSALTVVEPFESTQNALRADHPGLRVVPGVDDVVGSPSVVVLAVKPQMMDDVLGLLGVWSDALYVSIAAGKTLSYFEAGLGGDSAIVRVMPSTPDLAIAYPGKKSSCIM